MDDLQRARCIWAHPLYQQEYQRLQTLERGRAYCRHDLYHFLDVARQCQIAVLEQQLPIAKDVVYAAALLHDLGKGLQYAEQIPHHEASAALARKILPECGYLPSEIAQITHAILLHRQKTDDTQPLAALLYQADKQTRLCFCCTASADCNWPDEKRTKQF